MNRRNLVFGGVAALAGLAGVGVAWNKFQPHAVAPDAGTAISATGLNPDPTDFFWGLNFETPDGKNLALNAFRGKPLLVNFWATWCPPCVEELPLLDSFYRDQRAAGWQVLGIAVDQPSAVNKWLQARPLSFPVAMAGLNGTELSKSLGNLAGSLPFSVVFGASGEPLHRKIGKVSPEDLAAWVRLK
jgi:thiol-disulfide isomerase/thioredoxin